MEYRDSSARMDTSRIPMLVARRFVAATTFFWPAMAARVLNKCLRVLLNECLSRLRRGRGPLAKEPPVKCALIPVVILTIGLVTSSVLFAQAAATQPATSAPASQPCKVLASVGDYTITSAMVDDVLKRLDKNDLPPGAREQLVAQMVFFRLEDLYMDAVKVNVTDAELEDAKKELVAVAAQQKLTPDQFLEKNGFTPADFKRRVRERRMFKDALTAEKVDAFIKANPDYFNGTKVEASHILLMCPLMTSTADQKKALAKLEGIAADIKAGKITFEDAAKASSDCPSKAKGGSLGEFAFSEMVPEFATVAFAAKAGDVTPIVRSKFGFHIIKVTGRKAGTETPDPLKSKQVAQATLAADMQGKVFAQAMTDQPMTFVKDEAPKAPAAETKPAEATTQAK